MFGKTISQCLELMCRVVRYVDGGSWSDDDMMECQAKARQDGRQFENGVDGAAICSDCNQRRRSSSSSLSGHRTIGKPCIDRLGWIHPSGSQFYDDCNRCSCYNGRAMCTWKACR